LSHYYEIFGLSHYTCSAPMVYCEKEEEVGTVSVRFGCVVKKVSHWME